MSAFSAKEQRKAINKATKVQKRTADDLLAQNERFFSAQQEAQAPFLGLGKGAVSAVSREISSPLTATDSFRFRQSEANRALNQRLASLGALNSGSAIRRDLNLTQRLIDSEQGRRDQLISRALGIGQDTLGLNTQTIGNQSARQGNVLQNLGLFQTSAELEKGVANSNAIGGLFDLGLKGTGFSGFDFKNQNPGSIFKK